MPGTSTSGNRTAKRGTRYIQRFAVDKATAQTYKLLIVQRGWEYTTENVAKIAAEYAEAEWREYDTKNQESAEWEGQIL
jgi:hypothetical protein